MQLTTLLATTALAFISTIQALPIERRMDTSFYGVTYTARHPDGSCQSPSEIAKNVKLMKNNGITHIRSYAQECDALTNILKTIKSVGGGMTVLTGVWIDGTSNDDDEIDRLKSALHSDVDTSYIDGILVGNEVLFNNKMSSSQLVSKLKAVKSISKGIRVGSAEIDGTYSKELMAASDFVGVNIHPFFSDVTIKNAYDNFETRYNNFVKTTGGKETIVTEVGWPSSGAALGQAVPSVKNEKTFARQLTKSDIPYYYFEWQDASWKGSSFEGHFGILDGNMKIKI